MSGNDVLELATKRYPNSRPSARFDFGKRGLALSSFDISLTSMEVADDRNVEKLIEYFGRSLGFRDDVNLSVSYKDFKKGIRGAKLRDYLPSVTV
jgi:hypothetical protein